MDENKKEYFRNLLLNEKTRHNKMLNTMKDNNRANADRFSTDELSSYDNHPAEMGSQLYEIEHNMALEVNEKANVYNIEESLSRMENDKYGTCVKCGKDIDEERLEIIPYTSFCIDCEKEKEADIEYSSLMKDSYINRPVEEEVIDAPMGRKYLNKQEDDEYEGLDQLNDLMKYGSSSTPQDMGGYKDYEEFYTNKIDNQGIVDKMDNVSNEEYIDQIPD